MAEETNGRKIVLIMDGAGWHKSKELTIPENIEITYLPPYSPELNPVETLWQYIKNHTIKNKIYDTIEDLESTICSFVKNLTSHKISTICKVGYVYN